MPELMEDRTSDTARSTTARRPGRAGTSTTSVYVYGVVSAGAAPPAPLEDVAGRPVRTVVEGGLGALVSDVGDGEDAAADALGAHARVLEAAMRHTTVVPARSGTILDGDDAVRVALLAANAERLEHLLATLADRVQVQVEGRYDQPRLLRAIVAASPQIAALQERVDARPGDAAHYDRIRLDEAVATAIDLRRGQDADRVRAALGPIAEADRIEAVRTPDGAFNVSFLVARGQLDAFGAAVAVLREELGDEIRLGEVRPVAPTSFAEAEPAGAG